MNSKLLGTGLALSLLAGSFSAQAADFAPRYQPVAYYSWSGFYAGLNGGYGWGGSDWIVPGITVDPSGGMFGGTLGYNYHVGALLFGFEGDFDWTNLSGSAACGTFTCQTENTWLATMRARVGLALDRWLPYVTAGGAYGHVAASSSSPGALGADEALLGWTVGLGVEYAFAGNWSAKLEYLYVDLGSFDCLACAPGATTSNVGFAEHAFRIGLNYRFTGAILRRW